MSPPQSIMSKARSEKIYATLRKCYTTEALLALRFVRDGSRMVRLGMCRRELAVATSDDGRTWRVRPLVLQWRQP